MNTDSQVLPSSEVTLIKYFQETYVSVSTFPSQKRCVELLLVLALWRLGLVFSVPFQFLLTDKVKTIRSLSNLPDVNS